MRTYFSDKNLLRVILLLATTLLLGVASLSGEDHDLTITYHGNGHTSGRVPVNDQAYESGETVTVFGNIAELGRDEMFFKGWNDEPDGSGDDYVAGQRFSIGDESLTLYAQWGYHVDRYQDRAAQIWSTERSYSYRVVAPRKDGNYPLFVYTQGTWGSIWVEHIDQILTSMAERGFVAISVDYGQGTYPSSGTELLERARSIYDESDSDSAVNIVASSDANYKGAWADLHQGIVVSGFSQGAHMAALSAKFHSKVRAAVLIGNGISDGVPARAFLPDLLGIENLTFKPNQIRSIVGENDQFFGTNLAGVRKDQEATTGWDDPTDSRRDFIQPDGSGWSIAPGPHNFFNDYNGPLFSSFKDGTASWCMNPCFSWLASRAGSAVDPNSAGGDTWAEVAEMPTARRNLSTCVLNGEIYAIGGIGGLRSHQTYTPETDTWATKANMPTGRILFASSVANGKIYAIGGTTALLGGQPFATVEEYDPTTDTWTTKADMPSPRGLCSASEVNGIIYVIGGNKDNIDSSTVEAYDPVADTWTAKADMPTARQLLSTVVIKGKIYAIGGVITSQWPAVSSVEEYDPETDSWTTKADLPAPRGAAAVSVINDRIYFFGGTGGRGFDPEASVFVYDSVIDAWTEEGDMPVSLGGMCANTVAGSIYLIGGSSAPFPYDPSLNTVWKFTPEPNSDDFDGDGLLDSEELTIGTDPRRRDTDGDELSDGEEVNDSTTDPLNSDTDGDGLADGLEVAWSIDPLDGSTPEADHFLRSLGAQTGAFYRLGDTTSFQNQFAGADLKDAVFIVSVDFDEHAGSGPEVIWETGGATQGVSLVYEEGNRIVYRAAGARGFEVALVEVTLTQAQIDGGNVTILANYQIGDGTNSTISLIVDGVLVGSDNQPLEGDWSGGNAAGFGVPANSVAADGENQGLPDVVAFESGTINVDRGWLFYSEATWFPSETRIWPDVVPIGALGIEAEGIELGKGVDFFVSGFSFSSFFADAFGIENPGISPMAGAIYKGSLRSGEGALLVQPTGKPIAGLSYDARTDYLYATTGHSGGYLSGDYREGGVLVYNATTGALVAEIIFGDNRVINDLLVTEDAVYCTDSYNPELIKIVLEEGGALPAPPAFEVIPMTGFEMANVTDPEGNVIDVDLNANGIAGRFDSNQLFVINGATGVLYVVDGDSGTATPITVSGAETLFANGDGLYLDDTTLYICQNFQNKIAVVQLSEDGPEGIFVRNLTSPDLNIPTTITGYGDSIFAINTHFNELMFGDRSQVQTEVVQLSKSGEDWPDLIPLNVAGMEAEGITLGNGHDFFVGAFSYSSFFLGAAEHSLQSGAIYKGNLRTGEGQLLVQPTGTPIAGLSHDPRTNLLYAAKSTAQGGVLVYHSVTGALVADITFTLGADNKVINDVLVTETAVYCTDSVNPILYKILLGEGGTLPAEPVVEPLEMNGFVVDPDPTHFNANGIVSSADGKQLIVINISTGILYLVDTETGATAPIPVLGRKQRFADGDGLYLDGHTLYICQNFSNRIAVVQLSEDYTEGTFVRNLESLDLHVPTTIIGYGDSIYAINTHFGEIAAGNHATVLTDVVRLSTTPGPWIVATQVEFEGNAWINIGFESEASTATSDFVLQAAETLSGPWSVMEAQLVETPDGTYFHVPQNLESKQAFYRIWMRTKRN